MPLDSASLLRRLFDAPIRPGRVLWIGVRPARRAPLHAVASASLDPERGLDGDHYGKAGGKRQVTVVAAEHIAAVARYLGRDHVEPADLRRNIVIAGLNLAALKERRFRIGTAVLEWTGECHPCSRMEETFGAGGYNAVRGHGGITARVVSSGRVAIGDSLDRDDETLFGRGVALG